MTAGLVPKTSHIVLLSKTVQNSSKWCGVGSVSIGSEVIGQSALVEDLMSSVLTEKSGAEMDGDDHE